MADFPNALTEVAKVGTFGAEKYTDHGWKYVEKGQQRYTDALYRHLLATTPVDEESGLLHAAHAAWNALAVLEFMLTNKEKVRVSGVPYQVNIRQHLPGEQY